MSKKQIEDISTEELKEEIEERTKEEQHEEDIRLQLHEMREAIDVMSDKEINTTKSVKLSLICYLT